MKQLGKPRRNSCAYLPLRKSDERRFSQAGGRISQCLAAEHRESKVVNRLGQLRTDKVCPTRRESPRSKDFPRRGGLYAEVASRFTPSNKVVSQLA